jgi:hypothetical protein
MSHPTHHSWGALLRAKFDCSQQPLPSNLEVLLCFVDGAERRRQVQTKLNTSNPPLTAKFDLPADSIGYQPIRFRIQDLIGTATNGGSTLCVKPRNS